MLAKIWQIEKRKEFYIYGSKRITLDWVLSALSERLTLGEPAAIHEAAVKDSAGRRYSTCSPHDAYDILHGERAFECM